MRRSRNDAAIMGSMAWEAHRQEWRSRPDGVGSHRTPISGYDTIVQFTNGEVGMIQDVYVNDALRALGLREVPT